MIHSPMSSFLSSTPNLLHLAVNSWVLTAGFSFHGKGQPYVFHLASPGIPTHHLVSHCSPRCQHEHNMSLCTHSSGDTARLDLVPPRGGEKKTSSYYIGDRKKEVLPHLYPKGKGEGNVTVLQQLSVQSFPHPHLQSQFKILREVSL